MNKISILSRPGLGALAALVTSPAYADWALNMPRGVTELSGEIYDLHMLIFWICVVIGVGVFGAMLYSVVMHRKSRGVEASNFHESTVVEIAWTIVPFLILIAVAIPSAGMLLQVEDSSNPDLTIRVTGHQWLWEYDYVDTGVHFFSRIDRESDKARQRNSGIDPSSIEHYLRDVDNRMVVPIDKKVRLLLSSGDVIHAWWVPELGGKKDAIPGYINDMWFMAEEPGVYRGQCAELCGRGHGFMPIVVEAVPQAEYEQWVAEQGGNTDADSQLAQGQPSAEQTNAAAQTSTEVSPTAGSTSEDQEDGAPAVSGDGAPSAADDAASATDEAASDDSASASADLSKEALMSQGEQIYGNICVACHQPDGSGMPAAGFPALAGGAVTTGDIGTHIDRVLNGKGAMPPYKSTLDDQQIAALVTYERNAFGNDTGDVVQPAQIAEQR